MVCSRHVCTQALVPKQLKIATAGPSNPLSVHTVISAWSPQLSPPNPGPPPPPRLCSLAPHTQFCRWEESDLFSKVRLAVGGCIYELLEEGVPEGTSGGTRPPASGRRQLRPPKRPAAKGRVRKQRRKAASKGSVDRQC